MLPAWFWRIAFYFTHHSHQETMKHYLILYVCLFICCAAKTQDLTTMVDRITGDTTVSTGFDTLQPGGKDSIPDQVVGVKTIRKGTAKYWLFFYFSTADVSQQPVRIWPEKFCLPRKNQ